MGSDTSSSPAEGMLAGARSMRFRIAVSVAGFALLIILAQAVAQLVLFEDMEETLIDSTLDQQLGHTLVSWRRQHQLSAPNTPDMTLYHLAPGEPEDALPPYLLGLEIGNQERFQNGREFHVALRIDDGHRFILAYDVQEHEVRLRALTLVVVAGALVMGALMLALVYAISGRLSARLEGLAEQVVRGRQGASYVQPGMERELIVVARALDLHEARQAALLERERSVSANLSHELRTPLTAIRTDAELLAESPGVPAPACRRANRIVRNVDRISRLAGSLLALARQAQPELAEEVRLAAALREAWESTAAAHEGAPASLRLQVGEDVLVRCDPSLLLLVLRNVLDNALRHTAAGEVACRLEDSVLSLRDRGPGFTAAELDRVFDRFYRGGDSGGHGLGLALVKHVCAACGWGVSAVNAAGGGGLIRIDFGDSLGRA